MAQGIRIISPQERAAAAAGSRVMVLVIVHALRLQQLRATAGVARLTTTLAATAFAPLRRLKPGPITGGRFGGIAGAAADPLLQPGQLSGQGGELGVQFLVLLVLGEKQLSDAGWSCQPVRFWNPGRRWAHHRRFLHEMQAGIKLPSRVQQGRCSP
jgi:hypothetical protein